MAEQNDEAIRNAEARIEAQQKDLEDLPENDPMRQKLRMDLACSTADLVCARDDANEEISKAADMARSILDSLPDGNPWEGNIAAGAASIFETWYYQTKNPSHLDESIQASQRAVNHRSPEQDEAVQRYYFASRSDKLSRRIYAYFQDPSVGRDMADLHRSILHARNATDNTNLYTSDRVLRLQRFCDLVLEQAILLDQVQPVDQLIERRKREPDPTDDPDGVEVEDGSSMSRHNRNGIVVLHCYRYGFSRDTEDLNRIIEAIEEYFGHEGDHVAKLGQAASLFDSWELSSPEPPAIRVLQTAEALYRAMLARLPTNGLEHVKRRHTTLINLQAMLGPLYNFTGNAAYGWEADDISFLSARINILVSQSEENEKDETLNSTPGSIFSASGQSCVLKKRIMAHGLETKADEPVDLGRVWPLFLEDITPETYIRKRNDDGTIELGFTDEDEEISKWWNEYRAST